MKTRVTVMHGINLGALDRRPAGIYGGLSLFALEQQIGRYGRELGLEVRYFQSDFEGEFVQELHKAADFSDGLILNPGAWTHYAWALRDALEVSGLPAVEVHLSDVDNREAFRRVSVLEGVCIARVTGKGPDGYREALGHLKEAFTA